MLAWQEIEAVTFDVGGTLLQPWPSVGHVYAEVAARHGYEVKPEALNRQFAAAWQAKKGFDHSREAWRALVDQTFTGLVKPSPSQALFDELYRRFESPAAWRVFADARPALEQLRRRGLKLGVVSNWDERLRPLLEQLDLSRFFDVIVISVEAGLAKPAAGIFLEAAAGLKLPPPAVLHIGDSVTEDLDGAQAAGLKAVLLDRRKQGWGHPAIASLAELAGRVGQTIN